MADKVESAMASPLRADAQSPLGATGQSPVDDILPFTSQIERRVDNISLSATTAVSDGQRLRVEVCRRPRPYFQGIFSDRNVRPSAIDNLHRASIPVYMQVTENHKLKYIFGGIQT